MSFIVRIPLAIIGIILTIIFLPVEWMARREENRSKQQKKQSPPDDDTEP